MYKKPLFNDDCILEIETNEIIFPFSSKYYLYETWKYAVPEKDNEITEARDNKLRWNQGKESVNKLSDGTTEYVCYHPNGKLFYKKTVSKDNSQSEIRFDQEGWKTEESFKDEHSYKRSVYDSAGNRIQSLQIDLTSNLSSHNFFNTNGSIYLNKEEDKFSIKELHYSEASGEICKEVLIHKLNTAPFRKLSKYISEKGIVIKEVTEYRDTKVVKLFDGIGNLGEEYIESSDGVTEWKSYYSNGRVNSHGTLNRQGKMDGKWLFYHFNGNIALEANFKESSPVGTSYLYHEDGKLNRTVQNDSS